jgi:hypothetical protein
MVLSDYAVLVVCARRAQTTTIKRKSTALPKAELLNVSAVAIKKKHHYDSV